MIGQLSFGGAERQTYELVSRMNRSKFELSVICLTETPYPYGEGLSKSGIAVHYMKRVCHNDPFRLYGLRRLLWAQEPHVIQSVLHTANGYSYLAALKLDGPKLLFSVRSCAPPQNRLFDRVVYRRALKGATRIVVNSHAAKEFVRNHYDIPEAKLQVISNGIDVSRFNAELDTRGLHEELGLQRGDLIVLKVAKFAEHEKDYGTYLRAVAEIKRSSTKSVYFLCVGKGVRNTVLQEYCQQLGIADVTLLLEGRTDIERFYAVCNVSVLSSYYEGSPNVVAESLAAGKPVVATRVPGTEELLEQERCGFLVEVGDFRAMADRILTLLNNPSLAKKMGDRGRQIIERHYSLERMVRRYETLYEEICGPHTCTN